MDILRAINAFTTHTDVPNHAITYYTVVRRDLDIIKSGAYIAMTIISDGLIVSTMSSVRTKFHRFNIRDTEHSSYGGETLSLRASWFFL